jgi:hypothetical protein
MGSIGNKDLQFAKGQLFLLFWTTLLVENTSPQSSKRINNIKNGK